MKGQVFTIAKLHYINGVVYFLAEQGNTNLSTLASKYVETTKSGDVKHPKERVRTLIRFAEGLGLLTRSDKEQVKITDLGIQYYDLRSENKWALSKKQQDLLKNHISSDPYRNPTIYAITSILSLVHKGIEGVELQKQYAIAIEKEDSWNSDATYEGFTSFGLNYLAELGYTEPSDKPTVNRQKRTKNPPWARDELILALELYFKLGGAKASKNDPRIYKLSETLNSLPIHADRPDALKFRNSNGVYMKICNFLRYDPSYDGVGLSRGNKLEKEIWETYSDNLPLLKEVASRIKTIGQSETLRNKIKYIEIDETEEAKEGRTLLKLHKYRERSQSIVKKKKAYVLQQTGSLICEVCGFDFEKSYGKYGKGFIECHHKVPLHELLPNRKTTLKDLSLICANCHRIIHRIKPMLSIKGFNKLVRKAQN